MNRTYGIWLLVGGAAAIGLAFFLQAQVNASSAASRYAGLGASGSPAPWVVGGAGVLAILIGIFVLAQKSAGSRIAAGWHDDPDSPKRLRYHDGERWTEKTAEKP